MLTPLAFPKPTGLATDPTLSVDGHLQALRVGRYLKWDRKAKVSHIFCSQYVRTTQTADHIARVFAMDYMPSDRQLAKMCEEHVGADLLWKPVKPSFFRQYVCGTIRSSLHPTVPPRTVPLYVEQGLCDWAGLRPTALLSPPTFPTLTQLGGLIPKVDKKHPTLVEVVEQATEEVVRAEAIDAPDKYIVALESSDARTGRWVRHRETKAEVHVRSLVTVQRILRFLRDDSRHHRHGDVVIVAHAATVIACARALLAHEDPPGRWHLPKQNMGACVASVTQLMEIPEEHAGAQRWVVVRADDVSCHPHGPLFPWSYTEDQPAKL